MNLIIDIGNTRAKLTVFDGEEPIASTVTTHDLTGVEELAAKHNCRRGIVSTTAGLTGEAERKMAALPFPVLRMRGETPVPLTVTYRSRHTLGTDRLAAAVGARTLMPEGELLVVDAGTCVTIDFVDADNNYRGGNISPGLEMRLRAMHEGTARLPEVSSEGEVPEVGFDTVTALRSGAVRGLRMEIEGYIRHFRQKYPDVSVFLTGGDAKKLGISEEFIIFAPDFIVPRGLNTILRYNQ